jgi:DNA gyrase subunit A
MALDHIDKIIKLIKASKDASAAHAKLMQEFKFSERQATAILEMRLQKLAGLERKAIEDELKEKLALIKSLKALLGSPKKIRAVVKTEVEELKEKYGDPRRTKVVKGRAGEITTEDMIPDEDSILVYTKGGYIKRTNPDEYRAQKRGGIGVVDLNTKEEDFITIFVSARTHDDLLFFTDLGKVYKMKMYDIPEGRRATKGKSIMNFLQLGSDERVTSIVPMPKLAINSDDISLMMITKRGVAKKVAAASFADVRRNGLIAITLGKGDTLHSSLFVRKGDTVILVTKDGQSIHFKDADIRQMGRSAAGVRGMKIGEKDKIVGASVVPKGEKEAKVMVMSETGYGKLTPITEYKVQKRDGSGIKTAKLTPKTGVLMASGLITQGMQEVVAISRKGVVIRTSLEDISTLGRQTQGVRIMKLRAGDKIASLVTW